MSDLDKIVALPPRSAGNPTGREPLGIFLHVGRNDHKELLHMLSSGEAGIFGLVVEAPYVTRHRELIAEAKKRGLDLILDPKTQPMGLPGGNSSTLKALPWGMERHHVLSDFQGSAGKALISKIVDCAAEHGFSQLLCPTHILGGPNDRWLRTDIENANWIANEVARRGITLDLAYPLTVPIDIFRKPEERQALAAAMEDVKCSSIWLRIENFGDDASGEKLAAYVEGCRDFHRLGVPVIADYVGGLPGEAALALGAVGGICHGVTLGNSYKVSRWRRPPKSTTSGGGGYRVYIPSLDMLVKPEIAEALVRHSSRTRSKFGCKDTHCCPHGPTDAWDRPALHSTYQQIRLIEGLSALPPSLRANHFLDNRVRPVSDEVANLTAATGLPEDLMKAVRRKHKTMSRMRESVVWLTERFSTATAARPPERLARRRSGGANSKG